MREGTIVWVEIPVRDLERAADFYAGLFGWSFEPDEEHHRWIFAPPGRGAMGAITTARPVIRGGVKIGVAVESVRFSSNVAIELGGAPTSEVADAVGKAADVVDPDGNHLWLYQADFSSPVLGEDSPAEGTQ
jgi:predicted enzyme related to lactoylglutathione lyase